MTKGRNNKKVGKEGVWLNKNKNLSKKKFNSEKKMLKSGENAEREREREQR